MKQHLKTIASPKTWPVKRKGIVWITRPKPGKHSQNIGMALTTIMTKMIKVAKTAKEVKRIIHNQEVLIDGKRVKESRQIAGLMDNISFPLIKEYYRIILTTKGKLSAIAIDEKESKDKLCKITGKKLYKNKIQLTLHDGRTIITDNNEYKVNDSIVIKVPSQEISVHIPFAKNALAYLISGRNIGKMGNITEINGDIIIIKSGDSEFETNKKCVFIAGKDKEIIKLK